jgi:polyhydroxybutyrate depolymerase
MALHGRPDNGYGFAFLSDMNQVAQTENFIVVYPDGYDEEWNYATGISGYPDPGTDDVQFLKDVLDDVGQTFNIDRERLYLMGFSNGGFMTQRVACEAPDTFAAFGIIGATLQVGFEEFCDGKPAVPMIFMHGTEDPSVAWDGITWQGQQLTRSITDTLTYWAIHDDCAAEDSQVVDVPGTSTETSIRRFEFRGCADGTQIDFYAITGGGHTIPGVPDRLPAAQFGLTTTNIYAPQVLWDFFSQYPSQQ